jgi:ZIP family zinc transporter
VAAAGARSGVGFALLAAVTLDGVPENLALGVPLVDQTSWPLLLAIFCSNLPESLVGAVAMREGGQVGAASWPRGGVRGPADRRGHRRPRPGRGLGDEVLAVALGFAGGAVLASLADTLMPEAFEHGRPLNAFATAAGVFLSFVLAPEPRRAGGRSRRPSGTAAI